MYKWKWNRIQCKSYK